MVGMDVGLRFSLCFVCTSRKKTELNEEGLKMKSQLLSEERFLYDNLLQHQQLYFIAAKM